MFERLFKLKENGTTIRIEIMAGLTTFLTMAYIIFLQPAVLSKDFAGNPTGMDPGAVMLATCVASAVTTILMGLYAKYPIALAPGMGENFFFVSVMVSLAGAGVAESWRVALGIVLISGLIFFALSLFRLREAIIASVSPSLRNGIAVGIGLFIAFIGLQKGGLIVKNDGTLVALNSRLATPDMAVFLFGLLVASVLHCRRVRGSILWGILAGGALALALGKIKYTGVVGLPHVERRAAFNMVILGGMSLGEYAAKCLPFIIVFAFMDMFDTVGTLVGVAEQAGFVKDNTIPRAKEVLLCDAAGTVVGACMGTSTVTSYIESATGVEYGGRTGLTAVTTGILFVLALLFGPLAAMVGEFAPVTAPALVIVGAMMIQNVTKVDWKDYSESIPSFLTMIGIPLTFSIADGLALGFVSYPVIKLLSGKGREVKPLAYAVGAILVVYFVFVRARM